MQHITEGILVPLVVPCVSRCWQQSVHVLGTQNVVMRGDASIRVTIDLDFYWF